MSKNCTLTNRAACLLFFLFTINIVFTGKNLFADITSIDQATLGHLQSVLSAYKSVYSKLVKEDLKEIPDIAQKMMDAALQGTITEPEGAGRRMMQHILQGAEELKNADCLHETQTAYTSITNALLKYFKSSPDHLKRNELKLYWCKKDGYYWLQPQNLAPVCPYVSNELSVCTEREEVKQ